MWLMSGHLFEMKCLLVLSKKRQQLDAYPPETKRKITSKSF